MLYQLLLGCLFPQVLEFFHLKEHRRGKIVEYLNSLKCVYPVFTLIIFLDIEIWIQNKFSTFKSLIHKCQASIIFNKKLDFKIVILCRYLYFICKRFQDLFSSFAFISMHLRADLFVYSTDFNRSLIQLKKKFLLLLPFNFSLIPFMVLLQHGFYICHLNFLYIIKFHIYFIILFILF